MHILKARTGNCFLVRVLLFFGFVFNIPCIDGVLYKINDISLGDKDREKARNRMNILLGHIGNNYHEIYDKNLLMHNKTVAIIPGVINAAKVVGPYIYAAGEGIIFAAKVVTVVKNVYLVASLGNEIRKNYEECQKTKKTYSELKEIVEKNCKVNGYYLNQEALHRLSNLLLINKIQVSADFFKKLQRQCAINLLRYPYYLQDDYEKIHIDLLYDRDDMESSEKIIKSKIYQLQAANKDTIKNMNDVFLSALNRSSIALTKKLENAEISKEDYKLLFDGIQQAKKLDNFKPIIVYTSSSFNEKYSTNYKRQVDYMKTKEKLSQQKN